jgi:hypothetical protein
MKFTRSTPAPDRTLFVISGPGERTMSVVFSPGLEDLNRAKSLKERGGGWFWEDGVMTLELRTYAPCEDDPSLMEEDRKCEEFVDVSLPWDPTMELVHDEDHRPASDVVHHDLLVERLADEAERSLGERPGGEEWETSAAAFLKEATEMARKARIPQVLEDLLRYASPDEITKTVEAIVVRSVMDS